MAQALVGALPEGDWRLPSQAEQPPSGQQLPWGEVPHQARQQQQQQQARAGGSGQPEPAETAEAGTWPSHRQARGVMFEGEGEGPASAESTIGTNSAAGEAPGHDGPQSLPISFRQVPVVVLWAKCWPASRLAAVCMLLPLHLPHSARQGMSVLASLTWRPACCCTHCSLLAAVPTRHSLALSAALPCLRPLQAV